MVSRYGQFRCSFLLATVDYNFPYSPVDGRIFFIWAFFALLIGILIEKGSAEQEIASDKNIANKN